MIRGTSQEFRFKLPYSYDSISQLIIKFWQDNYDGPSSYRPLPIIKVKEQCSPCIDDYQCATTLNQEETLRFTDKRKAKVQLRGLAQGIPFATKEHLINVYPISDDSILDDKDEVIPTPPYEDLVVLDGQNVNQQSEDIVALDGKNIVFGGQ